MNDVLPKPFTKESMLRTLEKHLIQFKKDYVPPQGQQFANPNAPLGLNMSHIHAPPNLKEESSPGKSSSSASSWHSPSQIGTSPNQPNNPSYMQQIQGAQGGQYMMTPTHGNLGGGYQTQPPPQAMAAPPTTTRAHRRGISDLGVGGNEMPEKRQKMYPPPQGGFTR
jgi:osomolarity two-component system response regulator SKN7